MGTSLSGLKPKDTYFGLIKTTDNGTISATPKYLSDGSGNDSVVALGTESVGIGTDSPLGILHLFKSAATTRMLLDGDAGQSKIITYRTGGLQRFGLYVNNTAESGSNVGSDFQIRAYSDAGTLLSTPLFIKRSTGNIGIGTTSPTKALTIDANVNDDGFILRGATGSTIFSITKDGASNNTSELFQYSSGAANFAIRASSNPSYFNAGSFTFGATTNLGAKVNIKGTGATSATTSLLVQNSAGNTAFQVRDDREFSTSGGNVSLRDGMLFIGSNFITTYGQSIGFFGAPVSSAIVEMQSTTKGFLPPRMTTTQRNAITTPATGLRIYNTTTNTNDTYNGTSWQSNSVSGVAGAVQFSDGSGFASDAANLFWDDTNNRLGIGTNVPSSNLHVIGISRFSNLLVGLGNTQISATGTAATMNFASNGIGIAGSTAITPTARLQVQGTGATSATTSLLVQNSALTSILTVRDDGSIITQSSRTVFGFGNNSRNIVIDETESGVYSQGVGVVGYGGFGIRTFDGTAYSAVFTITGNGNQRVGIGTGSTSPNISAKLEVASTTQGFLPPRMTTIQRDAIASPAAGLIVYDSTNNSVAYRDAANWGYLSGATQSILGIGGTVNIPFSSGNIVQLSLTASTILTFSNAVVGTYILEVLQGGTGSYTLTYPANVKWSNGVAPTLTTTVGKTDIITLFYDGTNFFGTYSLNY